MTTILLRGGRVHTAADPDATAIAVTDGVISWIGGEHAVEMAGRPDHVVHLDNALVAPGFVDAHVHSTDAGLALTGLDLSGAATLADCLARVRAAAAAIEPGGLVWGHGWDETRWPENRPADPHRGRRGRREPARVSEPGRRAFGAGQLRAGRRP